MRGTLALALLLAALPARAAEPPRVTLEPPRGHGWWIGDRLEARARIEVDAGLAVDPATLPRPRPLDRGLELVDIAVTPAGAAGPGRIAFDVRLAYQSFNAPLEPKPVTVPATTLGFRGPDGSVTATIPAWRFVTAPLREILAPSVPEAIRPPPPLALADTRPLQYATIAGALLALAAGAGLARHRAWWPFTRRDRPFAAAAGAVARLPAGARGAALRPGFLALHRAFDASLGRRMLGEDLGDFFGVRPAFRAVFVETADFFTASRRLFFAPEGADAGGGAGTAGGAAGGEGGFDRARLVAFARRLAAIERGSRR